MKAQVLVLKLVRALLGLGVLVLGLGSIFTCAASFADYPVVRTRESAERWARGAYHVHSTGSDGRSSVEEIARAARRAGLDFVVLTDHNDFQVRPPRWEAGVLLIHGVEISTSTGHLVALGMRRPDDAKALQRGGVEAARALGGDTYLAHPVQRRNPWRDEPGARAATGLELYSADTFFREAMAHPISRLFPALAGYLGRAEHGVMGLVAPQPGATALLLRLSAEAGPKVALCAHDAHGLPAYEDVFRTLALYVPPSAAGMLPADAGEAQAHVVSVLREGRALCAFRALGEPDGVRWNGQPAFPRTLRAGEVLAVSLPEHAAGSLRLQVQGQGRLEPDGLHVRALAPGPLQIEVWVRAPGRLLATEWKPWLVPSPLQVVPAGSGF